MGQASACAAWSCELPVPSHPILLSPAWVPSQGGCAAPSVLLCRALGTREVMMAFPCEGARDVGNGQLTPCGASPSATCSRSCPLSIGV